MKKKLLTLIPSCLLFSCSTFCPATHGGQTGSGTVVDAVVAEFRKSHALYVYRLNPADTAAGMWICSYAVSRNFGDAGSYYANAAVFLLTDSASLTMDYVPVKQPFYPVFALKPDEKSRVSCLLSFGTDEIAFCRDDSVYVTCMADNMKSFRRMCNEIENGK